MKFGGVMTARINDWQMIPYLEVLGYDAAWVPDSQMIWSDCYAIMSLAAWHTSSIRLGTGLAIAGTRLAPVTAHSIATINKIAPGRTFLGIGTGHTAMRIMGQNPVPPTQFREYLRVVRALLDGEEVDYTLNGITKPVKFLDRELGALDLEHRVPIYVGANGPKALAATGAYGDGRVSAGNEPAEVLKRNLERVDRGAEEIGRTLPRDFHTSVLTYSCIMKPGDKLTDERVIHETGAQALSTLHFWYEIMMQRGSDNHVSGKARGVWEDYKHYVETDMPAERRHLLLHRGHCAFMPKEEARFVTPELIQASGGLVGEPDEIIERIRGLEAIGLKEVMLLPPTAVQRSNFKEFSEQIMARY